MIFTFGEIYALNSTKFILESEDFQVMNVNNHTDTDIYHLSIYFAHKRVITEIHGDSWKLHTAPIRSNVLKASV